MKKVHSNLKFRAIYGKQIDAKIADTWKIATVNPAQAQGFSKALAGLTDAQDDVDEDLGALLAAMCT